MKKQSYILLVITAVAVSITGCKKFVDVGQPKNQLTSSEVFADSTDAAGVLAGIYYSSISSPLAINSGGLTLYPGLSSDELVPTGSSISIVQFYADNVLTNNSQNYSLWLGGYNYIYSANACIEGVTGSSGIPASAKARLIAEARFIRGYQYFCLMNLYGGLPLVTGTDYKTTGILPRATREQVFVQIIGDLQFAESNLGVYAGSNDRPNSLTASAILAKVFLYQGKNNLAVAEAGKVINSGNFQLESDLNNVFLSGSAETIWQLDLPFNKYTWEGTAFVPTSSHGTPKYVINANLLNSFEEGDLRLSSWTKTNTSGTKSYIYPYKYKNNSLATVATEGYVLMRLADIYLIRAEAEMNSGDLGDALNDLNMIRARAGLTAVAATDGPSVFAAIRNERRHELFCEGGSRWFDLKRWNLANETLAPLKSSWSVNAILYPIPLDEINANPELVQNPGY